MAAALGPTGMKLQEALFELCEGEVQYTADLNNVLLVYRDPLLKLRLLTQDEAVR